MTTTLTSDLCNEVRDLREQLVAGKNRERALMNEALQLRVLLKTVLDAGRPHSHFCDCDRCLAFEAVRKELRGE